MPGYHPFLKLVRKYIPPPIMNSTIATYLSSSAWHQQHRGDYLLHAAMDATVVWIKPFKISVPDVFDAAVPIFRPRLALALETCSQHAICSLFFFTGTQQYIVNPNPIKCYQRDCGCGYPCLDALLDKEGGGGSSSCTGSSW
jgi:hypothetical protein